MAYQAAFNLERRDAVAACLDDIVVAPFEPEVAVLIAGEHVPRVIPRATEDLLCLLRLPPVFLHHSRMGIAAHAKHAVLTRRHRLKIVIKQLDDRAGRWPAATAWLQFGSDHVA